MNAATSRLLLDMLVDSALLFLLVATAFALVYGVALLAAPSRTLRFNESASRWFSTRSMQIALEKPHDLQRLVYRRHRWIGVLLLVGGGYVLWILLARYDPSLVTASLKRSLSPRLAGAILDAAWWLLVPANALAVLVGIVMFARPSLLRGVESFANREVSTEAVGTMLDGVYSAPDRLIRTYPRLIGVVIVIASLYAGATLARIVLK